VKSATKSELGDREWRLYSYITRTFLGCISYDATYDLVEAYMEIGSEEFKLKG
jgi:DNA topoisomerase IA